MREREITIRQLGGEIWAELDERRENGVEPFGDLTTKVLDAIINTTMGVLARHEGVVIINDKDLPVEILPPTAPAN